MKRFVSIAANVGKVRRERLQGRDYLVVRAKLIQPDAVLNGSQGPGLYPAEECAKDPMAWNIMPLVLWHPEANGDHITARDPKVLDKFGVGNIYRADGDDGLDSEAWFDEQLLHNADKLFAGQKGFPLHPRILNGEHVELSTGLFPEYQRKAGVSNGKRYEWIARNLKPDHVAVLPDQEGACNKKMGCGINANTRMCWGRPCESPGEPIGGTSGQPSGKPKSLHAEAREHLTKAGYKPEVTDLGGGKTKTRYRDPVTGGTVRLEEAVSGDEKFLVAKPAEGKTSGGWHSGLRELLKELRQKNKQATNAENPADGQPWMSLLGQLLRRLLGIETQEQAEVDPDFVASPADTAAADLTEAQDDVETPADLVASAETCPDCGGEMMDGKCSKCGYVIAANAWSDAARAAAAEARAASLAAGKKSLDLAGGDVPHSRSVSGEAERLGRSAESADDHEKAALIHTKASQAHAKVMSSLGKKEHGIAAEHHKAASDAHSKVAKLKAATEDHGYKLGTNSQGEAMKFDRKKSAVLANCKCDKKRAALNALDDETLEVVENAHKLTLVVNAYKKGGMAALNAEEGLDWMRIAKDFGIEGDPKSGPEFWGTLKKALDDASAKLGGDTATPPPAPESEAPVTMAAEEDDEMAANGVKIAKPLSEKQWLAAAPQSVRNRLGMLEKIEQQQRSALIGRIIANTPEGKRAAMRKLVANKTIDELEVLAPEERQVQNQEDRPSFWFGGPGQIAANVETDEDDADEIAAMAIPVGNSTKRKPKEAAKN